MKRMLILVGILLVLGGCSTGSNEAKYTLDEIIQAYEDEGVKVDKERKPLFQLIMAKDGVMFDIGEDGLVKMYEYDSVKDLDEAKDRFSVLEKMIIKSNIVLETSDKKAIEIFESIE